MPLIYLDDGDILNTAHVIKFAHLSNGRCRFLLSDGSVAAGVTDDPELAFAPIIPAAFGFKTITTDVVRGQRAWELRNVIGWRICPSGNFPVLEGADDGENDYAALLAPDGSVTDEEGNCYASLSEFQKVVAEEDAARIAMAA